MMAQTVLPFKGDTTDEKLTAHGGLALFGEFLQAMHLPRQLDEALPGLGAKSAIIRRNLCSRCC